MQVGQQMLVEAFQLTCEVFFCVCVCEVFYQLPSLTSCQDKGSFNL